MGCALSETTFLTLKPMPLLAVRRIGPYLDYSNLPPFSPGDLYPTLNAIKAKGDTSDAPRFAVPGVVVLGLFKDPEGNAMGLVEMDGDRVKIP